MRIIHVMKDGTIKKSIGGVIPNGDFYKVLQTILEKRGGENQARS